MAYKSICCKFAARPEKGLIMLLSFFFLRIDVVS